MTYRMLDGLKTTIGGTGMRAAALCLWSVLFGFHPATAAPPPQQELAGPSRDSGTAQPSVRPAMAEHEAERLPSVVFAPGSARLTPSATRLLDSFGRSLADDRLRLDCRSGADRDLAGRRADAVAGYLEQNFGVPRERIQVVIAGKVDDRRVALEDLGQ